MSMNKSKSYALSPYKAKYFYQVHHYDYNMTMTIQDI
jgi:hypothetical protein